MIFIAWGVLGIYSGTFMIPGVDGVQYDSKTAFAELIDVLWDSINVVWDEFLEFVDIVWDTILGRVDYATGGMLYEGKTDPNAESDLGVTMEDITLTQPQFYSDEAVEAYAIIIGSTLGEPIPFDFSCYANYDPDDTENDPEKNIQSSSVSPSSLVIDVKGMQDIDCSFNTGTLIEGSHDIAIISDFEFTTNGEQKVYFVDKKRADALGDIDLLEQYGIKDKDPVSTYSPGPVSSGS